MVFGGSAIAGTVIVASLVLGGIAPAAEAQRQVGAATIVVGPDASGNTVRPHVGDTLVVRLPGNPTTGYRWVIARRPPTLRLVASRYAPSTPARLGRGGTYIFRFKVGAGGGPLRLAYLRPWEKGKPPLRSFTLTIHAR